MTTGVFQEYHVSVEEVILCSESFRKFLTETQCLGHDLLEGSDQCSVLVTVELDELKPGDLQR